MRKAHAVRVQNAVRTATHFDAISRQSASQLSRYPPLLVSALFHRSSRFGAKETEIAGDVRWIRSNKKPLEGFYPEFRPRLIEEPKTTMRRCDFGRFSFLPLFFSKRKAAPLRFSIRADAIRPDGCALNRASCDALRCDRHAKCVAVSTEADVHKLPTNYNAGDFEIGNRIVNAVPFPTSLCTESSPPCALTIDLTSDRPSPTPALT